MRFAPGSRTPDTFELFIEPSLNDSDRAMTAEQYAAAQAESLKETCSTCHAEFEWQLDTLQDGRRYFCRQYCYDVGTAKMDCRKPAGATYCGIDI